ncbi:hypothetical protein [Longitalea luteola]|uniref:hypothetical protein n=1 Tax=Longitalea luteola TaxID=2812563 RepID=UPI001A96132B|nr:hypothetical protein [Longitalea luteola]
MVNCVRLTFLALILLIKTGTAQVRPAPPIFRLGATVSFGLSNLTSNHVGIGGLVGAEKMVSKYFAVETEASYNYFTGDKTIYADAKNKSYAIPLLAGIKAYPTSNIYASLRTGAVYFLLNNMSSPRVRLGYGLSGGINLPKKNNRLNVQLAYTGFPYDGISRGYATLAAAIIIK